jgi:hypothetical protein
VAVVADPGRDYEPALSIVDHIAYRGRPDLQVRLVPAVSTEATNSRAEAALATDLQKTITPLTVSPDAATCASVGAMIVLPDIDPNTNVPCTGDELRPVDFNTSVLLWGGESVSLRPRLPGFAPEGYRAFLH